MRGVAAVLVLTLVSGCSFFAPRHRPVGVVADLTGIGAFIVFSQRVNCDAAVPEKHLDCLARNDRLLDLSLVILAVAAVIGSVAIGWTMYDNAHHPSNEVDGIPRVVTQGPVLEAPLGIGTDDPELSRMGKQAWRAASRGQCEACRAMLALIARKDVGYRDRLAAEVTIKACVE
jgi:hypothetical protein